MDSVRLVYRAATWCRDSRDLFASFLLFTSLPVAGVTSLQTILQQSYTNSLMGLRRQRTPITSADMIRPIFRKRTPKCRMKIESYAESSVVARHATYTMALVRMIWS